LNANIGEQRFGAALTEQIAAWWKDDTTDTTLIRLLARLGTRTAQVGRSS